MNCPIENTQNVRMLFDIPVQAVTMDEVMTTVDQTIKSRARLDIGVINAAKVVNMKRDPELGEAVLSSDVIYADGIAVVWASKLLGKALPERIAGIDLMMKIFEKANESGYRVYCFGATEEVNKIVADKLAEEYPGLVLAGRRNGYYTDEEEEGIARQIGESTPDVLLVAMTSPKKERFMAKWCEVMNVPVVHGVGGSFDVYSGKVKRAPVFWQKIGMEWLYRVLQEPGRLWKRYLVTNTRFIMMLFREKFKRKK